MEYHNTAFVFGVQGYPLPRSVSLRETGKCALILYEGEGEVDNSTLAFPDCLCFGFVIYRPYCYIISAGVSCLLILASEVFDVEEEKQEIKEKREVKKKELSTEEIARRAKMDKGELELLERLERQLEEVKKTRLAMKKKAVEKKGRQSKEQNKKDILYAIYRRTLRAEEYERDIKELDFDKFLTRNHERVLFGLEPLDKPDDITHKKKKASKNRVYFEIPKRYKDVGKYLGTKWDADSKRWYVPEGTAPEVIERINLAVAKAREVDIMPNENGTFIADQPFWDSLSLYPGRELKQLAAAVASE